MDMEKINMDPLLGKGRTSDTTNDETRDAGDYEPPKQHPVKMDTDLLLPTGRKSDTTNDETRDAGDYEPPKQHPADASSSPKGSRNSQPIGADFDVDKWNEVVSLLQNELVACQNKSKTALDSCDAIRKEQTSFKKTYDNSLLKIQSELKGFELKIHTDAASSSPEGCQNSQPVDADFDVNKWNEVVLLLQGKLVACQNESKTTLDTCNAIRKDQISFKKTYDDSLQKIESKLEGFELKIHTDVDASSSLQAHGDLNSPDGIHGQLDALENDYAITRKHIDDSLLELRTDLEKQSDRISDGLIDLERKITDLTVKYDTLVAMYDTLRTFSQDAEKRLEKSKTERAVYEQMIEGPYKAFKERVAELFGGFRNFVLTIGFLGFFFTPSMSHGQWEGILAFSVGSAIATLVHGVSTCVSITGAFKELDGALKEAAGNESSIIKSHHLLLSARKGSQIRECVVEMLFLVLFSLAFEFLVGLYAFGNM